MRVLTRNKKGQSVTFIPYGKGKLVIKKQTKTEISINTKKNTSQEYVNDDKEEDSPCWPTVFDKGDVFEGMFEDMNTSGYGELKKADGTIMKGIWENNYLTNGKEILKDGTTYTGEF